MVYPLLQRRLTLLDLRLDGRIGMQFGLCRMVYYSFRSDWDLAKPEPKLSYNPDDKDARTLQLRQPAVYRRQGFYGGHLESAAESLIVAEAGLPSRFLTYSEFAKAYDDDGSNVRRAFAPVDRLFFRFHPAAHPVLWRLLLAQTCLYRAVQLSKEFDTSFKDTDSAVRAALGSTKWLDWVPPSEVEQPRLDANPAEAVRRYFESRLTPPAA